LVIVLISLREMLFISRSEMSTLIAIRIQRGHVLANRQ